MPNPEKRYVHISILAAVVGGILIFLPGWLGMDGMNGGYAISFIATFVTLSAVVVAWFFHRRAVVLERIIKGQNVLAHWTYSPSEWQAYTRAERTTQTQDNRGLWLVIFVISLVIGGAFWIFDPEAGRFVFFVLMGVCLLLAVVALGLPQLRYRRQQRSPGETWIAQQAVFFDGQLTAWGVLGSRMEGVTWQEAAEAVPACLVFELSILTRSGRQDQPLRIPVPGGREEEAREVMKEFRG
jgi:hypothetical protein